MTNFNPPHSLSVLHQVNVMVQPAYPIWIGADLIGKESSYEALPQATSAMIVSNTTVAPLYLERVKNALKKHYRNIYEVVLADGEAFKNWQTLDGIYTALLQHACDRKSTLFALGGGVIGDMTGFAAASYQRGVNFVQIPTTLLSQVDSSVGGKTGINHPLGKNMIGAFYQPVRVLCDIETLSTLAEREYICGLAEVIKYGPIADLDFFSWLEDNMARLRARDKDALAYAIKRSCEIKAWVVERDEREADLRAILNFGHTFAHAIEAGMGYGVWLHGEAVGVGMLMAARLSNLMGLVDDAFIMRLTHLIKSARLPMTAPVLDQHHNVEKYLTLMRVDKKNIGGVIRFTVINPPNIAKMATAPVELLTQVIHEHCAPFNLK